MLIVFAKNKVSFSWTGNLTWCRQPSKSEPWEAKRPASQKTRLRIQETQSTQKDYLKQILSDISHKSILTFQISFTKYFWIGLASCAKMKNCFKNVPFMEVQTHRRSQNSTTVKSAEALGSNPGRSWWRWLSRRLGCSKDKEGELNCGSAQKNLRAERGSCGWSLKSICLTSHQTTPPSWHQKTEMKIWSTSAQCWGFNSAFASNHRWLDKRNGRKQNKKSALKDTHWHLIMVIKYLLGLFGHCTLLILDRRAFCQKP